jgi:hypothetical protein
LYYFVVKLVGDELGSAFAISLDSLSVVTHEIPVQAEKIVVSPAMIQVSKKHRDDVLW